MSNSKNVNVIAKGKNKIRIFSRKTFKNDFEIQKMTLKM